MKKWLFLLLLIPFFLFLPKIASTSFGKPFFIRALKAKFHAEVDVESLKLSWLGPQRFEKVKWSRPEVRGEIEELTLAAPFWSLNGPVEIKSGTLFYEGGQIDGINAYFNGHQFQLTMSKDISLQMTAEYSEQGITLSSPLQARIQLTPALSRWLLKDVNPMLLTGIHSNGPITLQVEKENFFLPLPFNLKALRIGKAVLDLGRVTCENGKSLTLLMTLLKANQLQIVKQMEAWFTPIEFQMEKGILTAERLDVLLANTIHLCSWGQIDLIRDRLHMNIGLPADTLRTAFGIRNLSEDYVLKIPVQGSTKDPELVTGPAMTKIAALMATGQLPKKGVLAPFKNVLSASKTEAPPQKYPLPWK